MLCLNGCQASLDVTSDSRINWMRGIHA